MSEEIENNEFKVQLHKYRVIETGELFCADNESDDFPSELLGYDDAPSIKEMLSMGIIEKIEYNGKLPAIETSYIKGEMLDQEYKRIRHLTFANGCIGAGIEISLSGDGVYQLYVEYYKNEMQRIIINI